MMNVLSTHALIGPTSRRAVPGWTSCARCSAAAAAFACDYIQQHFEGVHVARPEGTYMLFVDCTDWCRAHGKTIEDVERACWEVGAAVQDGRMFHGPCHLRINLASPRSRIEKRSAGWMPMCSTPELPPIAPALLDWFHRCRRALPLPGGPHPLPCLGQ